MALSVNTNVAAENAQRWLNVNNTALSQSIERLSSGYRINSAADDPAGLVIANTLNAQVSGLAEATSNTEKAANMIKTADAALGEVTNLLISMRDLAVNAASTGVNGTTEIAADQAQVTSAIASLDRISSQTQFGSLILLDGSASGLVIQVGANAGQTVTVSLPDASAATLGVDGIDLTTDAQAAITALDAAIAAVNTARVNLGAFQSNTLESNLNSLSVAQENLSAAESSIRDADMASEMVGFSRNQILLQSSTAMLSQANQAPQVILQLLQSV